MKVEGWEGKETDDGEDESSFAKNRGTVTCTEYGVD